MERATATRSRFPQSGPYATCNASYWPEVMSNCNGYFNYTTSVKFLTTSCSTGSGCNGTAPDATFVDTQYTAGRKKTTQYSSCNAYNLFGLGSCAC